MSVFTTDLGTISSQTIDEDRGWNLRTAAIAVVNKRRWTYAFASRSHFPRWALAVGVGGCSTLLCADKAQHNRSASARLERREDRSEANWKSSGEPEPLVPTLSLGEVALTKPLSRYFLRLPPRHVCLTFSHTLPALWLNISTAFWSIRVRVFGRSSDNRKNKHIRVGFSK